MSLWPYLGIISGGGGAKEPKTSLTAGVIEPDQKFHQKLMAFRKISEGKLDAPREPLKPKPPQSISSLLARVSFPDVHWTPYRK